MSEAMTLSLEEIEAALTEAKDAKGEPYPVCAFELTNEKYTTLLSMAKRSIELEKGIEEIANYAGDCKREVHASYYYIEQMANQLRFPESEASDD